MRWMHPERDAQLELSLDDVFLLPDYFDGVSRQDVDLTPVDLSFGPPASQPIVSANMNGVTGKRMAETMARYGGLGVLPQDMSLDTVARIVQHIKAADPRLDTPLTVTPKATMRDVLGLIRKRAHDMVVVVDDARRPLGVITHADLRTQDQYTPADRLIGAKLLTLPSGTSNETAFEFMMEHRLRAVPMVHASGELAGVLTSEDAVRLGVLEPARSPQKELVVAAAVGISASALDHAKALVDLGIDGIVLDTAHGHQKRMLEAVEAIRKALPRTIPLVAGNVCTAAGTQALCEAGADIIKVNVGPGAMCTTRMQTGVGRPTFTAVLHSAEVARRYGRHVWADGGVRNPRDVALYLAAGASRVMVGTMLAGTYESPGDIRFDAEGKLYKENYGMASARAVKDRSADLKAYERAQKAFFKEGISHSRIYIRPEHPSVGAVLMNLLTGLRSAMTYLGASDLAAFHERAIVGVQSMAGFSEGRPHGRVRT